MRVGRSGSVHLANHRNDVDVNRQFVHFHLLICVLVVFIISVLEKSDVVHNNFKMSYQLKINELKRLMSRTEACLEM